MSVALAALAGAGLLVCAVSAPAKAPPDAAASSGPPRLISYRAAEHRHFDRVVWVFSGGLPARKARYVNAVTEDASGKPVRLQGRAFLQVTLTGVDWTAPNVPAEPTLTPHLAVLQQMKPAGVFEGYFTFGLGLAYRTTYRFSTAHHPDRLILDLDHR